MISAVSQCSDSEIWSAMSGAPHGRLDAAHDELEVGQVVALAVGGVIRNVDWSSERAVQAVPAVEHEDLERGHADVVDERSGISSMCSRIIGARWNA